MTFIELLITITVLGAAIAGTLMLLVSSMTSSQLAWDTTVATTHAEHVLEEMVDRQSMFDIIITKWDKWFKKENIVLLPDEVIEVTYADKNANPLEVRVNVSWKRKKRINNVELMTRLAK